MIQHQENFTKSSLQKYNKRLTYNRKYRIDIYNDKGDIGMLDKVKKWLCNKFLKSNIKVEYLKEIPNMNGEIIAKRFRSAFDYLKRMVGEIESELKDKIHLYIIDIEKSGEGQFYIIDDKNKDYVCKFDNQFCSELYKILCKDNKLKVIDNSYLLNLQSTEAIEPLVKELIKCAKNIDNLDIESNQYCQFSKIKIGSVMGNPSFVRFYGIGCDETDIKRGEKRISIYELFESMLNECIGYMESPTDRNIINTFKIWEEYANKILKKSNIIDNSELITEIASTRYESAECVGGILFCNDKESNPLIQFEEIEFKSENIRVIRKYLEMSQNGYCLWAKKEGAAYYIYGIDKRKKAHNYVLLQFTGYRKWLVQDNNNVLLERKGEKYSIPDIKKKDRDIKKSLISFLNGDVANLRCGDKDIEHLIKIVYVAKMQQHGTMIIFAHPDEAKRLTNYFWEKNRGIKLRKKVDLTYKNKMQELLLNLSAIDGALIIDTKGKCHAIGVILDGIANKKCNMARGARYNSALTFVTNKNFEDIYGFSSERCKVFVFSEDKTVNILPDG